jgi:hypothetical protein
MQIKLAGTEIIGRTGFDYDSKTVVCPLYLRIVPATAGIRLFSHLALEGGSLDRVAPYEVLERGVDFVRYAVKR